MPNIELDLNKINIENLRILENILEGNTCQLKSSDRIRIIDIPDSLRYCNRILDKKDLITFAMLAHEVLQKIKYPGMDLSKIPFRYIIKDLINKDIIYGCHWMEYVGNGDATEEDINCAVAYNAVRKKIA